MEPSSSKSFINSEVTKMAKSYLIQTSPRKKSDNSVNLQTISHNLVSKDATKHLVVSKRFSQHPEEL